MASHITIVIGMPSKFDAMHALLCIRYGVLRPYRTWKRSCARTCALPTGTEVANGPTYKGEVGCSRARPVCLATVFYSTCAMALPTWSESKRKEKDGKDCEQMEAQVPEGSLYNTVQIRITYLVPAVPTDAQLPKLSISILMHG